MPSFRIPFVLVLASTIWLSIPAFADDERCGPEIKKKQVEVIEVEAQLPRSVLDEVEAKEGKTFEVILQEEVVVTSGKPQKKALRLAASRGCPYLIIGQMREAPTGRMIQDQGRSSGNIPMYREEVQKIVHAMFAVEAEK